MKTFGQHIDLRGGGFITVDGCVSREDAVRKAVDLARREGWRPRRWWEFWMPKCSAAVRAEYERQVAAKEGKTNG